VIQVEAPEHADAFRADATGPTHHVRQGLRATAATVGLAA
jgi:hypothetical protein